MGVMAWSATSAMMSFTWPTCHHMLAQWLLLWWSLLHLIHAGCFLNRALLQEQTWGCKPSSKNLSCRFLLMFADSPLCLGNRSSGRLRYVQETPNALRSPQTENCRWAFVVAISLCWKGEVQMHCSSSCTAGCREWESLKEQLSESIIVALRDAGRGTDRCRARVNLKHSRIPNGFRGTPLCT